MPIINLIFLITQRVWRSLLWSFYALVKSDKKYVATNIHCKVVPRPACEPGIFCFSFIFSPEQFLRPFGYCATLRILSERFKPFFQSSHSLKQHLPISGRSPIFQELAPRERKRLIVQNRPQHQIWAFRWTGLGSENNHGSHQCLLNFSNIFQN